MPLPAALRRVDEARGEQATPVRGSVAPVGVERLGRP